jgi:RNase P subunit RPR2
MMAKAGRPKGSKTKKVAVVDAVRTRCIKCGSTQRTKYSQRRELNTSGVLPDGTEFDKVIWRRTTCKKCGQVRDDREYLKEG